MSRLRTILAALAILAAWPAYAGQPAYVEDEDPATCATIGLNCPPGQDWPNTRETIEAIDQLDAIRSGACDNHTAPVRTWCNDSPKRKR